MLQLLQCNSCNPCSVFFSFMLSCQTVRSALWWEPQEDHPCVQSRHAWFDCLWFDSNIWLAFGWFLFLSWGPHIVGHRGLSRKPSKHQTCKHSRKVHINWKLIIRTYLSIKSQNLSRKTSRRFFCPLENSSGGIMDWLDWIFFINRSLVIHSPAYLPSKDSKSWIFQIGNLSTQNQKRKMERILCEV